MKVLRGGLIGFGCGALSGGLFLALPTIGNHEFAHETTQSSLSMFVIGAIVGAPVGLIVGLIVGAFAKRTK